MSLDAPSQASPPIQSIEALVAWIRAGEKPNGPLRVGIESEKLGVFEESGRPVPLVGDRSVSKVLEGLAPRTGGQLLVEQGVPMGVQYADASVALEPGGQLELSGAPSKSLQVLADEIRDHVSHVDALSAPLGITWITSGYRPWGPRAEVPWLPRYRYQLMRERLPGDLAHEMMQQTASVQANFDFTSERDLSEKLAVASLWSPVLTALTVNSPLTDGKPNGFKSFRYHVWTRVDPSRCGLVRVMYEGFTYRDYVEWALDVPLLFVRRQGQYLAAGGRTLRDVWKDGFENEPASMQDFADLVSTLFPELRVKRVLEVRGADAVNPALTLAITALWTGLFYDDETRRAAARSHHPKFESLVAFQDDVARRGLAAELDGTSARELGRELLKFARLGLQRRFERGEAADETHFLEPLEQIVDEGVTPADQQLKVLSKGGGFRELLEVLRYR